MQPSARSFFELSRHFKTTILVSVDFVLLNIAFLAGVLLRYNTLPDTLLAHPWLPPVAALIGVVSCALFGVYRSVIRHIATRALFNLLIALSIASLFIVVVVYMTRTTELARSVPILWLLTGFIFTAGFRYAIRSIFLRWGIESREKNEIIIYGAGSTGVSMASALIQAGHYAIKAFIDADPNLQGRMIQGIRVFSPEKLPQLLKKRPDYTLLLALPSLDKAARKQLLDELSQYPLRIKNLPPMQRLVSGLSIRDLPNVDIESLLERPTVTPDPALMRQAIANKVVLVTGAGGSIGSEIVNQVLNHQPKKLIVLDHSEFAIYQLLKAHPNANITPIIGSVMNTQLLDKVFKQQAIQTVYHAAAYKHVPLVEQNRLSGIENNVIGTWLCAQAAAQYQVERFVLISSDKAVRPTNVMGASKRFAELCLHYLSQQPNNPTCFSMVRFGNVLGSSGSVIPLFKEQIANGGPVTVTDKEMIRYFMTIPEATQLVIQAGAMAEKSGELFLLDMGEPVNIDHLARRMIHLLGYSIKQPESQASTDASSLTKRKSGDIEIIYSGLRSGEKLYEELLIEAASQATDHPRIFKAQEPFDRELFESQFARLQQAIADQDEIGAVKVLEKTVDGFQPESPRHN